MATGAAAILSALDVALRHDPFYAQVTVRSIAPHDGSTLATAAGVDAVWRDRRAAEGGAGDGGGGGVPAETIRWRLRASEIAFVGGVKVRDEVVGGDGAVWVIDSVWLAVRLQRYVCECHRKRV